MASEQYANNAQTILSGAIDATQTVIIVSNSSLMPSSGDFRIKIESEYLLVTAVSGNNLTVVRGIEDSTAATHADTTPVYHVLTKTALLRLVETKNNGVLVSQRRRLNFTTDGILVATITDDSVNDQVNVNIGVDPTRNANVIVDNGLATQTSSSDVDRYDFTIPFTTTKNMSSLLIQARVGEGVDGNPTLDTNHWTVSNVSFYRSDNATTGVPDGIKIKVIRQPYTTGTSPAGIPIDLYWAVLDKDALGAGSGGGIYCVNYASIPSSPSNNTMYRILDRPGIDFVGSSGTWKIFHQNQLVTPLVDSGFAWVNQNGSTLTVDNARTIIQSTVTNGPSSISMRVMTAPTTPHSMVMKYNPLWLGNGNYQGCGLVLRDSASGKLTIMYRDWEGGAKWRVTKYSSPTTYYSDYYNSTNPSTTANWEWMKFYDDGVSTRYFYNSPDSVNWQLIYSWSRTDWITNDQIGFFINPQGTSGAGFGMKIFSWQVGTS